MSGEEESVSWVPAFEGQRPPFEPGNVVGRQFEPGNVVGRQFEPGNETGPRATAGNEMAVTHGAYSPRRVDPLAKEHVELLLADESLGYLKAPAYRFELWAWARAEARVQLIEEYLETRGKGGALADPGSERVKSASLELHRAAARAASCRNRLGLNPLARAKLGKDVAQGQAANADVARVMAQLSKLELDGKLPPGWAATLGGEES